jgi:hypothetical protein
MSTIPIVHSDETIVIYFKATIERYDLFHAEFREIQSKRGVVKGFTVTSQQTTTTLLIETLWAHEASNNSLGVNRKSNTYMMSLSRTNNTMGRTHIVYVTITVKYMKYR